MPKVKISEYSATANSNTDVASINIDEGCAPSGINNAIRAVMGHLKDFQQGTNGDPFNGPVNGTVGATTASTGAFTTLTTTGTINLITVGRGAGAVSTNTAVGASALAANAGGSGITAVGSGAFASNTTGAVGAAFGVNAGTANTTGNYNSVFGAYAFDANTTGSSNTAIGTEALQANTTASNNTAVGYQAGYSNTTATGLTALGYQAAYSNSTGASYTTAIGWQALYANTTGLYNTAVGQSSLGANTTGGSNSSLGLASLATNTTGSNNTALGNSALYFNTTANSNTALGYQAGYTNTTGSNNTNIGYQAGYTNPSSGTNVFVGYQAGYAFNAVGQNSANAFIGYSAGSSVTSGLKNTILGSYSGNQGGLDIRTASNYIVLSDGDGNPRIFTGGAYIDFGNGLVNQGGSIRLQDTAANNYGPVIVGRTGAISSPTDQWVMGSNSAVKGGTTYNTFTITAGGSGGVSLTSGATSWVSASDERLKDIIEPITDAANKVSQLRAVIGKYKTDADGTRRSFLIAQDLQAVLPEAVSEGRNSKDDEIEYLQVAYTEVIPLLVAAIKELKVEIDLLKGN